MTDYASKLKKLIHIHSAFSEASKDNILQEVYGCESDDYLYESAKKVLVVGDQGTGKTSIIKRYVHNFYSDHYRSTIGLDFQLKNITLEDGRSLRVQFWDIMGQERFGTMTKIFFRNAVGAFVVFDITSADTFEMVKRWKTLLGDFTIPCVLLANKCDLPGRTGIVHNHFLMDQFCRHYGFLTWFEVSAKENLNISTACEYLVEYILETEKEENDKKFEDSIKLHKTSRLTKCCS